MACGSSIVTSALGRLPCLLQEEHLSLLGLGDHIIDDLQEDLRQTQVLLEDLDAKSNVDQTIQKQVEEIRTLSFHLNNQIEEYVFNFDWKNKGSGSIFDKRAWTSKFSTGKRNIKKDIKSFRCKLSSFSASVLASGIQKIEPSTEKLTIGMSPNVTTTVPPDFVGRERDVYNLVPLLVDDTGSKIISICGMGGVGKTTIAKKLYQHPDVRPCFDRFAFVYVSQHCESSAVLKNIFKDLVPETAGIELTTIELCHHLQIVLAEKKCLLIFDDIWASNTWKELALALPDIVTMKSKILITTRYRRITEGLDYTLTGLSEEESWKLFSKAIPAYQFNSYDYKQMEIIGRDMVRRCAGLPLAILVLRGLMITKGSLIQWEMLYNKLKFGYRDEALRHLDQEIASVLYLSYEDLSYKLKACFLSLFSHFLNTDRDMLPNVLFKQWIDEGLVSPEDRREGETMINVGQRYLDELSRRNFFTRQFKWPHDGNLFFRIHDVMWEFCISMSKSDANEVAQRFIVDLGDCVQSMLNKDIYNDGTGGSLLSRSLTISNGGSSTKFKNEWRWPNGINHYFDFKFLCVLRFINCNFDTGGNSLQGIDMLIHLRHLCFQRCLYAKLPPSLCRLPYLQTLMFPFSRHCTVPIPFGRMKRLTYLWLPEFDAAFKEDKFPLNNLIYVESLRGVRSDTCQIDGLFSLNQLQELTIVVKNNVDDLEKLMNYLQSSCSHKLQDATLVLSEFNFDSIEGKNLLMHLSYCSRLTFLRVIDCSIKLAGLQQFCFPGNIVNLILENLVADEDLLKIVQKLPKLDKIHLLQVEIGGNELLCSDGGFPQLRYLRLVNVSNLKRIVIDEGSMPILESFVVQQCDCLKMLPEGLRFLKSLIRVRVVNMPESFISRLHSPDGEDFYKVQHAPTIEIVSS